MVEDTLKKTAREWLYVFDRDKMGKMGLWSSFPSLQNSVSWGAVLLKRRLKVTPLRDRAAGF
jgi:hypothetical protein